MAFPAILAAVIPLIDKIIPDKEAAAKAKLELLTMEQRGEFKAIDADLEISRQQSEVNKADAQSNHWFQAGWRPFIGWVCGAACAWNWVGLGFAKFLLAVADIQLEVPLEAASLYEMLPILAGMLGLGGYRTFEKLKGVNKR